MMIKLNQYCAFIMLALFGLMMPVGERPETPLPSVPPDLEITLWADSPLLQTPLAMDTDVKGRIWVIEGELSPLRETMADASRQTAAGCVRILEDSNHDGKADKSTVFASDSLLADAQGIAVLQDKVVISCKRHLVIYQDTNGDDQPDSREMRLTEWGRDAAHVSFRPLVAGPDGKWYLSTRSMGARTVKHLPDGMVQMKNNDLRDSAQTNQKKRERHPSDTLRTWTGGMQLRLNSDGNGMKILAHGFCNSRETCIDSYGDMWQADNDEEAGASRVAWLREGANAGYYSADGKRTGMDDYRPGQEIFAACWHQEDPGFMPAGDNLGSGFLTGMLLNESDALGKHYRGMLLCADAARHSIFSYLPRPKGAGFDLGRRRQLIYTLPESEGLPLRDDTTNASDPRHGFRPGDLLVGTDGAWYIADAQQPLKNKGRIYRIAPKWTQLKTPVIDLKTEAGQIEALKSPAVNVRNSGFEALLRKGNDALPAVAALLKSENPYHRARALFLLARLSEQAREEVWNVLQNSTDERLRHAAFRALRGAVFPFEWQSLYSTYAADPTLRIRCETAVGTRDLPLEIRRKLVPNYFRAFDGDDPWFLDALGTVAEGMEEYLWPHWLNLPKCKPDSIQWNYTLSKFVWRLHPRSALPALEKWAEHPRLPASEHQKAITALAHIDDHNAAKTLLRLAKSRQSDLSQQALYWLAFRQSNRWSDLIPWKETGLNLRQVRQQTRAEKQRALLLNNQWSPAQRLQLIPSMGTDSCGGAVLTDMASKNQLPAPFHNAAAAVLFSNPDRDVRTKAALWFKRPGSDRKWPLPALVALAPNSSAGEKVFENACASCHVDKGDALKLTRLSKKYDRAALLDRLLNPSAFSSASSMPDPVALKMTEQQLADVTEYLLNLSH